MFCQCYLTSLTHAMFYNSHEFDRFSCRCVTICNHRHLKLVTCPSSNWRPYSTSSMPFQRMFCKRTQRKSFIRGSGGTTWNQKYGSKEHHLRMDFLITIRRQVNLSTLTLTHGSVGCMEMSTKILLEGFCLKKMCELSFRLHEMPFM